jgi:hypothetical protein
MCGDYLTFERLWSLHIHHLASLTDCVFQEGANRHDAGEMLPLSLDAPVAKWHESPRTSAGLHRNPRPCVLVLGLCGSHVAP